MFSSASRLTSNSFGPNAIIDPSDDFIRVALDMIAYCSMSHRLNSFYSEPQPEFAVAMADFLKECSERFTRPRLLQAVMYGKTAKYQADIKKMKDLADESMIEFTLIWSNSLLIACSRGDAKSTPNTQT